MDHLGREKSVIAHIFLDSSTLQTLQDYGEFIYDVMAIEEDDKIRSIPH